jgi:plastocyanin
MRSIITLGVALLVLLGWSIVGSADTGTVKILGDEHFVPNALVMATFKFAPGPLSTGSGATITWDNMGNQASADEPHTVTIVNKGDLPTSIDQVFACGAPGTVCATALAAHSAGALPVPTTGCPAGRVAVQPPGSPVAFCFLQEVEAAGSASGLDKPGDSLFIAADGTAAATVSAPSGTTLYYLCAIHPWMQGSISVR